MKFDDAIKGKIELLLQTTLPFSDPSVKRIRDLKTYYGYKINWVVNHSWAYPCSGCQLPHRKLISKGNSQVFEKTADEHCCFCKDTLDIKYMIIPQLETYANHRSAEFKEKDLEKHQENLPLYKILSPELVFKLEEKRQLEKIIPTVT